MAKKTTTGVITRILTRKKINKSFNISDFAFAKQINELIPFCSQELNIELIKCFFSYFKSFIHP